MPLELDMASSGKTGDFFTNFKPMFQPLPEDGRVETVPFLTSCSEIVKVFDLLGTAFKPVKSDVQGNIDKLQKKYDKNPERFKTLNDMLEEEIETKTTTAKESAATALLWLKRGLEYIRSFLVLVLEDHRNGTKTEKLVGFIKQGYEATLKKYHGWMIQKIFGVVSYATPNRGPFLKAIAYGADPSPEDVEKMFESLEKLCNALGPNVDNIGALLIELNLDSDKKV